MNSEVRSLARLPVSIHRGTVWCRYNRWIAYLDTSFTSPVTSCDITSIGQHSIWTYLTGLILYSVPYLASQDALDGYNKWARVLYGVARVVSCFNLNLKDLMISFL